MTTKDTQENTETPEASTAADVLDQALADPAKVDLDAKVVVVEKETVAAAKDEPVPADKKSQYKTREAAIKSAIHWEKTAGEQATESGKKDDVIDAKDTQIAALNRGLADLKAKFDAQKVETPAKKDGDEEDDAFYNIIKDAIHKEVPSLIEPLKQNAARQKADTPVKSLQNYHAGIK